MKFPLEKVEMPFLGNSFAQQEIQKQLSKDVMGQEFCTGQFDFFSYFPPVSGVFIMYGKLWLRTWYIVCHIFSPQKNGKDELWELQRAQFEPFSVQMFNGFS